MWHIILHLPSLQIPSQSFGGITGIERWIKGYLVHCFLMLSISILQEISPWCSLEGVMLMLKLQYFGHLMGRVESLEKTLMLGRDWGQEEKGTTEDEMAGWHHWLDGHGFEWTPGVYDGQGGLVCCDSWGHKESDTTEWTELNWTECCPWFHWICLWIGKPQSCSGIWNCTHCFHSGEKYFL